VQSIAKDPDFPIMLVRTVRYMPGFTVTQPLGILYLASALRQHGYRNIQLVDMRPSRMEVDELIERVRRFKPRFLGLSCLSYESPAVAQIVDRVRTLDPSIHIALGGPLPSSMKEDTFQVVPADSAAIGEGDQTIIKLVDGLADGQYPPQDGANADIAGLLFRDHLQTEHTCEPPFLDDLDQLPNPAWDLIDLTKYYGITNFNFFLKYPNYMSIMTTRGCPYRCAYCHNVLGKVFRKRSVDHVMREIHTLVRNYGIRELHIIDDSFNLDLERAKAILDEIAKLRPRVAIAFPNGVRSDRIDEEFLKKAKAAGAYKINFAVETASPRIQKKIRKNLDLEKVREMITISDSLDIIGHGFFMLGFPTETEDEMRQTIDYALSSRLHSANFFIVQPFEGTDIYDMFKELHPEMANSSDRFSYYEANFEIYEIPRTRVQDLVKQAHRDFFLTPWRLAKLIRIMPHKSALLKGGLRLAYRGFLGKG
jgi:anaerobic magnesium-protoporphyrin IX monomethyl ester cyclase